MTYPLPFPPAKPARRHLLSGFSLIETTMALAIAGGATLSLVALIPPALEQVRSAAGDTASARIVQFANAEYQMRPWGDVLAQEANATPSKFYFDMQGAPVEPTDLDAAFGAQVAVVAAHTLPGAPDVNTRLRTLQVTVTDHVHAPNPFQRGPGVKRYQLLIAQTDKD